MYGQHVPAIRNFKHSDYKAHPQNWAISQASDKSMFFANSEGLLSFDGNIWELNKLPNGKIIRSVLAYKNKIYTGAYGEFGYWTNDVCQGWTYTSLKEKIPDHCIDKEEIWHMLAVDDRVYFQSFSVLLMYQNDSIQRIHLPGSIMFLQKVEDKLVFQALEHGLFLLNRDNTWSALPNTTFFKKKTVTGIVSLTNEKWLVATNSHGIFVYENQMVTAWKPELSQYFSEIQINKVLRNHKNQIVLGTIRGGVFIFDQNTDLLFHINTTNGLQNNTILSLFQDNNLDIWLGLDKGISLLSMDESWLVFYDYKDEIGTIFTAAKQGTYLYLGTNQGVYYFDQSKDNNPSTPNKFRLVKGTQGQVWQLKALNHGIFCGHNEGSFIIKKAEASKISEITGGWYSEEVLINKEPFILQGSYTGLVLFSNNKSIQYVGKMAGYSLPIKKFIRQGEDKIWVVGPNTGLHLLTLDDSFSKVIHIKKYDIGMADPNLEINDHLGQLWVTTNGKQFQYQQKTDQFVAVHELKDDAQPYLIRHLNSTDWCKVYKDSFVLIKAYQRPQHFYYSLNADYNNIAQISSEEYLFCLTEGYIISGKKPEFNKIADSKIVIDKLMLVHSQHCFPYDSSKVIEIPSHQNICRLYFHQTNYPSLQKFQYTAGKENEVWSDIFQPNYVELVDLPVGDHEIKIRSTNQLHTSTLFLRVLPAWYQSKLAFVSYFFLLILIGFGIKKYIDHLLVEEKIKLEISSERLLKEHIIELENNRLIQDNLTKTKELANATMHLVQKNELLLEIKEELIEVRKKGDHALNTKDFQMMMKQINDNLTVQENKNLFDASFEEVHDTFLKALKAKYPDLTPADLKLAAYIKMNLTSKEIAPLFNISIRGLENKRYRLRKKLHLPNDANLTDFFNQTSV